MRAKIWILMACLGCCATTAQAAGPIKLIKVAVSCSGDDLLGERLCLALKEKIRASKGFELVDERDAETAQSGFGVHLISEDTANRDTEDAGALSAIAVVFTIPKREPLLDGFVTAYIEICGAHRIDDVASTIFADIDRDSDPLRQISH